MRVAIFCPCLQQQEMSKLQKFSGFVPCLMMNQVIIFN